MKSHEKKSGNKGSNLSSLLKRRSWLKAAGWGAGAAFISGLSRPGPSKAAPLDRLLGPAAQGVKNLDPHAGLSVILLGTGTPIPNPARACAATLVVAGQRTFLIDTGRSFLPRLFAAGLRDVDLVLFTHYHSDHIGGFGEFMGDLLVSPTVAHAIMEHSVQVSIGIAEAALAEVGDEVDVVQIAEDMGTQNQLFMQPAMYRRILKPYHRRLVDAIKSGTGARVLLHSDGAIYDIIADFIDIGIEVLNPIQVSATGLEDTARLKAEFGKDLSFWGAVDTHRVLPFGSPDEVAGEVRKRIDELGPDGYVLAAVHTIMAEVPPENIIAMLRTAQNHRVQGV